MEVWVIRVCSMYLFETRRSTLALIICGPNSSIGVCANFALGCTPRGVHIVTG